MEHRQQVCHWFTVDVFDHLKHGGRVSSAAAVVGTALQIKPLLHVDQEGKLAVAEKPRGRKQAIHAQLARMERGLGSTNFKNSCDRSWRLPGWGKAAGGIRSLETIYAMQQAGCNRFGIGLSSALTLFRDIP